MHSTLSYTQCAQCATAYQPPIPPPLLSLSLSLSQAFILFFDVGEIDQKGRKAQENLKKLREIELKKLWVIKHYFVRKGGRRICNGKLEKNNTKTHIKKKKIYQLQQNCKKEKKNPKESKERESTHKFFFFWGEIWIEWEKWHWIYTK